MEREKFEKLVSEGYECLPEWVREKIKNVALLVEDEPSAEDRKEQGLAEGETLLGLYKGIPLSEHVRQIVADTVWHEFAHHFGMNEGEVRDRERRRGEF